MKIRKELDEYDFRELYELAVTRDGEQLTGWFKRSARSVPGVKRLMQQSPLLAKGEVRAYQEAGLAEIGLKAVNYLFSGAGAARGMEGALLDSD